MLSIDKFPEVEKLVASRKYVLAFLKDSASAQKVQVSVPPTDDDKLIWSVCGLHSQWITDEADTSAIIGIARRAAQTALAELEAEIIGYGVELPAD